MCYRFPKNLLASFLTRKCKPARIVAFTACPADHQRRGRGAHASDQIKDGPNDLGHNSVDYGGKDDPHDRIRNQHHRNGRHSPCVARPVSEIGFHGVLLHWDTQPQQEKFPDFGRRDRSWAAPAISGMLCRMGMPSLLRKVFLVDLLQGLRVTFRYQDPKEIYTEQYPLERPQIAERYRGAPRLNVNPDTDETMCIACDLCALACPEHLIVVSSERNEKTRRKELTNFTYDLSRCMFCGLCEDACPTDALELTQDFELASYTRDGAIWDRQMLEKGPQPTQYRK
jgi:NADH-quinone oxidoreductase subunit I